MPNHEQLALIYNNVSDMIFLIQVEEGFTFRCINVNNAYLQGTGLERDQVVDKVIEDILDEDYAMFVISKYKEAIHKREKITYEEKVDLSKGECTFEITLLPIFDEDRCTYLLGVSKDVSKKKADEELLLKSEKLSVVGQLAAGVAHEIRNPLTSIKGFLKLLEPRVLNDKKTNEYIQVMSSELGRIEEIINEFLMLAKPQTPKFESVDVKIVLKEVIQLLTSQANLLGVKIVTRMLTNLPAILCDKNLLKQVLINIIQNALDASSVGGKVVISVSRNDNYIRFRISDHGHGITEERMERLGEPFYSTKEKGTGLGLMISQQIIEKHHGKLNIISKINKGTTVDIHLPSSKCDLH